MSEYLNREPTETELDDERRRLAIQSYIQEHGFSPLSPMLTPPPSPTSVVPNPPADSEFSPVTPPDSGDDEPAGSGDERTPAWMGAITREEYDLAFARRGRDEDTTNLGHHSQMPH
jgi:hypothetical protein